MKPAKKNQKISDTPMLCRICCMLLCILFILIDDTVCASVLRMDSQRGRTGEKIRFTVSAADVPNEVNALGFEVSYDASVLQFRGFAPGSLTQNFTHFSASNTDFGTVRIGGFDAGENRISQGASGGLVTLEFEVVAEKSCDVQMQNLLDDVRDWSVTSGSFSGNSNKEDEEGNVDDTEKTDADTQDPSESNQSAANADSDMSADIALNPLENALSSLNSGPASFPDGTEENTDMPMLETGKTGQNRENLEEKQNPQKISGDRHSLKSPNSEPNSEKDGRKKAADQILESENRKVPELSAMHTEQQKVQTMAEVPEMEKTSVNAEKGNCKPGIWHWLMFAVLMLILGMQILILWQVMRLKKR
ncbi:MAG: cohesin domain-containing protein [Desulfobacterales bacterium]